MPACSKAIPPRSHAEGMLSPHRAGSAPADREKIQLIETIPSGPSVTPELLHIAPGWPDASPRSATSCALRLQRRLAMAMSGGDGVLRDWIAL